MYEKIETYLCSSACSGDGMLGSDSGTGQREGNHACEISDTCEKDVGLCDDAGLLQPEKVMDQNSYEQ